MFNEASGVGVKTDYFQVYEMNQKAFSKKKILLTKLKTSRYAETDAKILSLTFNMAAVFSDLWQLAVKCELMKICLLFMRMLPS